MLKSNMSSDEKGSSRLFFTWVQDVHSVLEAYPPFFPGKKELCDFKRRLVHDSMLQNLQVMTATKSKLGYSTQEEKPR